jgi:hypothetical protein
LATNPETKPYLAVRSVKKAHSSGASVTPRTQPGERWEGREEEGEWRAGGDAGRERREGGGRWRRKKGGRGKRRGDETQS